MSDRIDKIHEVLLEQNKDFSKFQIKMIEELGTLKSTTNSINTEVKKTNGRVTLLEKNFLLIQDDKKKQIIVGAVNKKWVLGILGLLGFVWSVVSVLVYRYIEQRLFK